MVKLSQQTEQETKNVSQGERVVSDRSRLFHSVRFVPYEALFAVSEPCRSEGEVTRIGTLLQTHKVINQSAGGNNTYVKYVCSTSCKF